MKKSDINPLPEYFERYINLISDIELSQAFDDSIRQIDGLNIEKLKRIGDKTYALDKWTIKEIFQHVIDWERILGQRTLLYARREGSIPQGIDEQILAKNMKAERRTVDELLEELKITRLSTKAMFASFDDEMLLQTGICWKYEMSVLAMGFNIIGHQIHHFRIMEEKYFPLAD